MSTVEKRVTIEDADGGDGFGFRIKWEALDHRAYFSAYEVVAMEQDGGTKFFNHAEGEENTREISLSSPYATGSIGWDGCSHIQLLEDHICGAHGFKKHISLMRYLYTRASVAMGRGIDGLDEEWGAKEPDIFNTAKITEPLWPAEWGLHPDHCRDVVQGDAYEIPYFPTTAPVICDVGSNVGGFVRWAVKRFPGCTMHCYEPHPDNFAKLKQTVATMIPAEDAARVTLYQQAVAGHAQKAMLNFHKDSVNCGEWSLFVEAGKGSVEVDVISATDLPDADILKVDCEGGELILLSTLHAAGKLGNFKAIMLETHSDTFIPPIINNLTALGFTLTGRKDPYPNRSELKFVKTNLLPENFKLPTL